MSYGSTEFSGETSLESFLTPVAGNPLGDRLLDRRRRLSGLPGHLDQRPGRRRDGPVLRLGAGPLRVRDRLGQPVGPAGRRRRRQRLLRGADLPVGQRRLLRRPSHPGRLGRRRLRDRRLGLRLVRHAVNGTPWIGVYGTSVATPIVSGMISLAQQNRINSGLLPLTSPQINAKIYAAYNSPSLLDLFPRHHGREQLREDSAGTVTTPASTPSPATTGPPGWAARSPTSSWPCSPP